MDTENLTNDELSDVLEGQGYVYRRASGQYHATKSNPESEQSFSVDALTYIKSHGQVSHERATKYLTWLKGKGISHTEP